MFALGSDAVWGGFKDFENFAAGEVLFFLSELNPNRLAGQAERDEYGATVLQASHRFAAVGEFFEGDLMFRI